MKRRAFSNSSQKEKYKGVCPVQLIYQHPEKAINPRWRLRKVLEESDTDYLICDEISTMLDVITQAQI